MRRIKALLDPQGLLNPGVILNDDPQAHLKNLKPLPAADPASTSASNAASANPSALRAG
jgi:D-lactate dehydrogenase